MNFSPSDLMSALFRYLIEAKEVNLREICENECDRRHEIHHTGWCCYMEFIEMHSHASRHCFSYENYF